MKSTSGSCSVLRRAAIALLLAFLGSHARAAFPEYCIQNQQQLEDAIAGLQSQAATLDIVSGLFTFPANDLGDWAFAPYSVIRGGYSANCITRSLAVGETVLSGGAGQVELLGTLTFDRLTFVNPDFELRTDIAVPFNPSPTITFSHVKFYGVTGFFGPLQVEWTWDASFGGGVRIVDSLFVQNNVSNAFPEYACILNLTAFDGGAPVYTLINDTIYGNSGTANGVCVQNSFGGGDGFGVLLAHDNVFFGNGGADLYSDTPNLELVDNTIGVANYPVAGNTVVNGASTQDPQLDANFRPVEPNSRSINSGEYDDGSFAATDLAGNPRVTGTRIDRGAFESSVDDAFLLVVTNTQDGDEPPPPGSLRAAITNANANGGGEITFAIGSDCSPRKVITLTKGLPAITAPVSIFGYTQPGASKNTRDVGNDAVVCIVLEGSGSVQHGLVAADAANAVLDVQGIAFSGFTDAAIRINGGSHHNISGNRTGGVVGPITLSPSPYGVYVAAGVSGVSIGGFDPANRNMIGEATTDGILVAGPAGQTPAASHVSILGNYVGVGWNVLSGDYVDRGNAVKGIHVLGSDNTIDGNVVGYNGNDGVDLDGASATGNFVEDNYIGVSENGDAAGNGSMGVRVENGGHDNKIRSNSIEHNAGTGVRIVSGLGNTIRRNGLFENGSYGIDLAGGGVTDNDDDSELGALLLANRALNFPTLTLATGTATSGVVKGTLQSTEGTYIVDVYSNPLCDGSGHGEGAHWLGSTKVTIDPPVGQIGTAAFSLNFANPGSMFNNPTPVTATATDAADNISPGNTSEFSACLSTTYDGIFANGFESGP